MLTLCLLLQLLDKNRTIMVMLFHLQAQLDLHKLFHVIGSRLVLAIYCTQHTNINCGTYILNHYKNQSGKWPKALAYYNVGPTGYNNNRKMKKQGKRYAKQVKQHQKNLKDAL